MIGRNRLPLPPEALGRHRGGHGAAHPDCRNGRRVATTDQRGTADNCDPSLGDRRAGNDRRDRLWLLNAFAVVLLILLGAAGEAPGYDRMLKTNPTKRRVHSSFRQGCMFYDLIPTMRDDWLCPLIQRFSEMLQQQPLFAAVFGSV